MKYKDLWIQEQDLRIKAESKIRKLKALLSLAPGTEYFVESDGKLFHTDLEDGASCGPIKQGLQPTKNREK